MEVFQGPSGVVVERVDAGRGHADDSRQGARVDAAQVAQDDNVELVLGQSAQGVEEAREFADLGEADGGVLDAALGDSGERC
ncbi:hypothetical protein [Streptomyces sp. NPDC005548]|uniref:hypothetical protein n=1 Tax=Streptomyces sp. NPDC005548 TaxID=3364724 RepID=UPI0036A313AE